APLLLHFFHEAADQRRAGDFGQTGDDGARLLHHLGGVVAHRFGEGAIVLAPRAADERSRQPPRIFELLVETHVVVVDGQGLSHAAVETERHAAVTAKGKIQTVDAAPVTKAAHERRLVGPQILIAGYERAVAAQ